VHRFVGTLITSTVSDVFFHSSFLSSPLRKSVCRGEVGWSTKVGCEKERAGGHARENERSQEQEQEQEQKQPPLEESASSCRSAPVSTVTEPTLGTRATSGFNPSPYPAHPPPYPPTNPTLPPFLPAASCLPAPSHRAHLPLPVHRPSSRHQHVPTRHRRALAGHPCRRPPAQRLALHTPAADVSTCGTPTDKTQAQTQRETHRRRRSDSNTRCNTDTHCNTRCNSDTSTTPQRQTSRQNADAD